MIEPSSPLAPYYPKDFASDPNGKRQPWEAVVKIPFIDGDQLLEVVNKILEADEKSVDGELMTSAERRRNLKGTCHTFVPERDPEMANGAANGKPVNGQRKSPSKRKATRVN
jgi:5'-3' exonuclease